MNKLIGHLTPYQKIIVADQDIVTHVEKRQHDVEECAHIDKYITEINEGVIGHLTPYQRIIGS